MGLDACNMQLFSFDFASTRQRTFFWILQFASVVTNISDDPYWISMVNSLELIELSSINKVSLV